MPNIVEHGTRSFAGKDDARSVVLAVRPGGRDHRPAS